MLPSTNPKASANLVLPYMAEKIAEKTAPPRERTRTRSRSWGWEMGR